MQSLFTNENNLKCLYFCLANLLIITGLSAQKKDVVFLSSEDKIFKTLYLDPNESQAYGAVNAYWENDTFGHKTYMPVGFGFYKPLIRWNKKRAVEFGFDASAHAQFEWDPANEVSPRNFLNADFKISLLLNVRLQEQHALRLRFYHVSSHLGDDYLIQQKINSYFPNPNNYEQLDLTWYFDRPSVDFYTGAGAVVRPVTIRKRICFQAGSHWDKPLSEGNLPLGFVAGFDLKVLQEDNFNPRLKAAAGVRFGAPDERPVRLMVEFYRGNLPYSPYEFKRVQWLGLGLHFAPSF